MAGLGARVARGLNQKTLAGRLGLKEQQIQRYEASEYASASLARIRSVAEVLGEGCLNGGLDDRRNLAKIQGFQGGVVNA